MPPLSPASRIGPRVKTRCGGWTCIRRPGLLPSAGPLRIPWQTPLFPCHCAEPGGARANASRPPALRGNSVGTPLNSRGLFEGRKPSRRLGPPNPHSGCRRMAIVSPQTSWLGLAILPLQRGVLAAVTVFASEFVWVWSSRKDCAGGKQIVINDDNNSIYWPISRISKLFGG